MAFDINYTYRNFLDKNLLKHIDKSGLSDGGTVFLNKKFIICNINLYGISGSINEEDAMDTIQHEIEHIYVFIKFGDYHPHICIFI